MIRAKNTVLDCLLSFHTLPDAFHMLFSFSPSGLTDISYMLQHRSLREHICHTASCLATLIFLRFISDVLLSQNKFPGQKSSIFHQGKSCAWWYLASH